MRVEEPRREEKSGQPICEEAREVTVLKPLGDEDHRGGGSVTNTSCASAESFQESFRFTAHLTLLIHILHSFHFASVPQSTDSWSYEHATLCKCNLAEREMIKIKLGFLVVFSPPPIL